MATDGKYPGYHTAQPVVLFAFDPETEKPVPLHALKNSLDIHDADVHNVIINKYVHQHTATTTTLAAVSAVNATQIEVASSAGFVLGDPIHINTTSIETTHPIVTGIAGNILTLDRRLDKAHFVGDEVIKCVIDMAATGYAGSRLAPQEFWAGPPPGQVWHLTRILFSITHSTAGDLGLFGNLAALPNGLLLRVKVNGQYGTLTNWKTSADMKTDMFDVEFDSRSTGGGTWGTSGRGTFTNAGAVLRLDGDQGDRFEVYNQDDIQSLLFFGMKVQGHIEGL